MSSRPNLHPACTILICVALCATIVRADTNALLGRVPGDANAIVIVDVEKILASPMAASNNWRDKLADAYASKPLIVPPEAKRVVMAACVNPRQMESLWQVSLMELSGGISVSAIAKAEGGVMDSISGKQAAWSPIDAYFVQLDASTLAAVAPANRQFTARWLRGVGTPAKLPDYLRTAAAQSSAAPWIMAIDLSDVTNPARVQNTLDNHPPTTIADQKLDEKALADLLAGIKGITFTVNIASDATGKCSVDFSRDPSLLREIGKPLLLEFLDDMGGGIDDLKNWDSTITGNSLVLQGKLSPEGLKRLFSVLDPPAPSQADESGPAKASAPGAADPMAAASQAYYRSVANTLDNLAKQTAPGQASLQTSAAWMTRDATAISRLPVLNVDPDLVAWGGTVSAKLKEASNALAVGQQRVQARTASIHSTYSGSDNQGQAEVDRRNRVKQQQQAVAEEKANALNAVNEILKQIDTSRAEVRTQMAQKYKVDF